MRNKTARQYVHLIQLFANFYSKSFSTECFSILNEEYVEICVNTRSVFLLDQENQNRLEYDCDKYDCVRKALMKASRVIKMQILCERLVRKDEKIVFKGANACAVVT